jgi:hypothetical protein
MPTPDTCTGAGMRANATPPSCSGNPATGLFPGKLAVHRCLRRFRHATAMPRTPAPSHISTAGHRLNHDRTHAVRHGLTLPYRSGPIDGNINRLIMLKRQMFGRASVDLLRNAHS